MLNTIRGILETPAKKIFKSFCLFIMLSLLVPTFAFGTPILLLEAIVAGVSATANVVGGVVALKDLVNWASLSDDHPLYTDGNLGPTLSISATRTAFTFDLVQPLQIDFFVDDAPIRLRGTMQGDEGQGAFDAWKFDLTFTYESYVNGPFGGTADKLIADGFFTHVTRCAPNNGEVIPAASLTAYAAIYEDLVGPFPTTLTNEGSHDIELHLNNDPSMPEHYDMLTRVTLTATQGEDDAFDRWQFTVKGKHSPIPEPATMFLLSIGLVGLVGANRRHLKK